MVSTLDFESNDPGSNPGKTSLSIKFDSMFICFSNKQIRKKMAIVERDVHNSFTPIDYNGTMLPYGITLPALHFTDDEPVSPPCSPRAEGEVEVRPRIIFHNYGIYPWDLIPYSKTSEMRFRQHKFSKYPSKKNMNKILRKTHKLKQPGGASCNQRR
jgi:hypothetical protein